MRMMKITIELTPKILDILSQDELKALVDTLTPTELKELLILKINNEKQHTSIIAEDNNTNKRISPSSIKDIIIQNKRKRFDKYPKEIVDGILNQIKEGKKVLDISNEKGIPESTIYTWVKNNSNISKIKKQQLGRVRSKDESVQLAKDILDDPTNDLKRIKDLFPPIDGELNKLTQHQILTEYNQHKLSIKQLAEKFDVNIPIIKRIIYNS